MRTGSQSCYCLLMHPMYTWNDNEGWWAHNSMNDNICLYSAPGPFSISPCEQTVPPILVLQQIGITSFKWLMVLYILWKCRAALKFHVTYQCFLPISHVGIPWMLNECYTFPPELESLQKHTVNGLEMWLNVKVPAFYFFRSNFFLNWNWS